MTKIYNTDQIIASAQKLYNKIPIHMHWITHPSTFFIKQYRRLRIDLLRLDLWIVEGVERNSGKPITVLCAAQDNETRSYLLELVFGKSYREQYFKRDWVWNLPDVIEKVKPSCSMMLVEVFKHYRALIRLNNWFYIPLFVWGEVDIPLSPSVMKKQSVLSDLRRIRRNALKFEITRDPQRLDDFYYNMYVPYITRAHGRKSYIDTYDTMRKKFQDSDLLLITKNGTCIAGCIIRYEGEAPILLNSGIRDGNLEYLNDGVTAAIYYFSILYLEEKGFTKVRTGASKAFLRDGVLRLKRKWSQRIIGTVSEGFALKILSDTDAIRAFLRNNPFIFESEGLLSGAVFVDQEKPLSPEEIRQIDKENFYPGLSRLLICSLQRDNETENSIIPPEISEHIVMSSSENMFGKING